MAFDPENQEQINRLTRTVRWSRKRLKPFRRNEERFRKQYVGRFYSDDGSKTSVLVNLVEFFVNTYLRSLVPTDPATFVTVRDPRLRQAKFKLNMSLDQLIREIRLGESLRDCVFDAFFSVGLIKIGITEGSRPTQGFLHNEWQPFADPVLLRNWVHDMTAERWDQIDFAGDRYKITIDELEEVEGVNKQALKEIKDQRKMRGILTEQNNTVLGPDKKTDRDAALRDYVEVWDLWMPKEQQIVTLFDATNDPSDVRGKAVASRDHQGPENGPYRRLGFSRVSGVTMPLSPVATLIELHEFDNALWRKASRQAQNQKTVVGARQGSVRDAQKLIQGSDMDVVSIADPNALRDFRFNGADPGTVSMARSAMQLFNQMGGNPELLAGVAAPSETLGQDRLLNANANQRLRSMQEDVMEFTTGVVKDLAWWLWTDPLIRLPATKRLPTGEQISIVFTPEDREGDFLDYNFEVNPYSLQSRTPQEEFNLLMQILQLIQSMRPDFAAQGGFINVEKLLRLISDLTNFRSLDEFVMFTDAAGAESLRNQAVGQPSERIAIQGPRRDGRATANRDVQDLAGIVNMIGRNNGQGDIISANGRQS